MVFLYQPLYMYNLIATLLTGSLDLRYMATILGTLLTSALSDYGVRVWRSSIQSTKAYHCIRLFISSFNYTFLAV